MKPRSDTVPDPGREAWYTLCGDVNNDMVRRVFSAAANMTADGVDTAHVLLQSHGGYVSDGICLHNYLRHLGVRFVMYNDGAVASIAVALYLVGSQRVAAETARFMLHKSHASPAPGCGIDALRIMAEGLAADDLRTESILRDALTLSEEQWNIHAHADLHLTASQALQAGLVHALGYFAPPRGLEVINM